MTEATKKAIEDIEHCHHYFKNGGSYYALEDQTIETILAALKADLCATAEGVEKEIDVEDVIAWADGVRAAFCTEYSNRITDTEAAISGAVNNCVQAIAALSTSRDDGWRDISTAPKDGSQFLIHTQRVGFAVVRHDPDDEYATPNELNPHGFSLSVDDGKHGPYPLRGDYPTHWMPLPPPPAKPETGE